MPLFAFGRMQAELFYFFRVIMAMLCGLVVGIEREANAKSAGLRTHMIIAMVSALLTVVSKYGFSDVLSKYSGVDPSRVASTIAGSIGFLSAGIIFAKGSEVTGLATSAGLLATVAIGMAVGAGMYLLGLTSTAGLVIMQWFLSRRLAKKRGGWDDCSVTVRMSGIDLRDMESKLEAKGVRVMRVKAKRSGKDKGMMYAVLSLEYPDGMSFEDILDMMDEMKGVTSMEVKYKVQ